mmetsp:Transcript_4013/g.6615  ORF Transcript_4013/g.6615 Transcript_4013/m.6615 type:complete len:210 (-) Transcript_4013:38-667(-)
MDVPTHAVPATRTPPTNANGNDGNAKLRVGGAAPINADPRHNDDSSTCGNVPATAVQNINMAGGAVQGHGHIAPHPSVTTATEGATASLVTATTTATTGAMVQQGLHNTNPLPPQQQRPADIPAAFPGLPTEDVQPRPSETGNRYGLQAALERQAATLTPERYKTELAWQSDVNAEKQKEDKLKEDVLMGQDTLRHDNFNFQSHTSYIE